LFFARIPKILLTPKILPKKSKQQQKYQIMLVFGILWKYDWNSSELSRPEFSEIRIF